MQYLNIVLHNDLKVPIYIEVPIPPELVASIQSSKVRMAEFTIHEKGKDGQLVEPKTSGKSEIARFKIL